MQLAVTVVSPGSGRRADVVIHADAETTVAQAAVEMVRLMHGETGVVVGGRAAARHRHCSLAATGCPVT